MNTESLVSMGVASGCHRWSWRHLYVLVPVLIENLDFFEEDLVAREDEIGGPAALVVMVRPGITMPNAAVRREIADQLCLHHQRISCAATLILRRGFFASTFLSVGSQVMRDSGAKPQQRLYTDVDKAAKWVADTTREHGVPADQIGETLSEVEGRMAVGCTS
ncbi:MAG: hypothetical protein JKY37_12000 [Nannocystaceae bacterium]|nr:hypothetical protein [Nannocystaceae bacterium]